MKTKENHHHLILIMILYLAGIFMGAIDTGIVTPARTIIQSSLGVAAQSGIWMITIYTLSYAASVPIMGKLADRYGRKFVYLTCIFLFGTGSLFCGLSEEFGGFPLLIVARAIQAIGGGGIVPIATAEFGTTFPKEKRGMALGLVGGVYGIANVFGASAGSAILDLCGINNWKYIFFINVPISLFIIVCGLIVLKNNKDYEERTKIDLFGIFTLTIMILSLLYGIKNLDFFHFMDSFKTKDVYPFLLVFFVLIPVFIFAEKKAQDPVISLHYFTTRNVLVTMILSTLSGFVMMGVIFVPQFSENCLRLSTGSGGYLVIILGLFAGVGAPISGKLIDRYGAKRILAFGFACSIAGALFMMFVTTKHPMMATVLIGLALSGLGMGFTMGTPVNYMMLANTDPRQSNSALATLSLVRSLGTAIAPAIMVGFLANAGMNVQGNMMTLLPQKLTMPELPYAQEISTQLDVLKKDPQMKAMIDQMKLPDLSKDISIDMSSLSATKSFSLPAELLTRLESSDVTTITDNTKYMANTMFQKMEPGLIAQIQDGIDSGIEGIDAASKGMKAAGAPEEALTSMKTLMDQMTAMRDGVPDAFNLALKDYLTQIDQNSGNLEKAFQTTLNEGFFQIYELSAIAAAIAILTVLLYQPKKEETNS